MRVIAGFLILTLSLAGCVSSTAIKPTELPKFNASQTVVTSPDGRHVKTENVVQLETPEGRLAEVKGEADVRVQLKDTTQMHFKYPIRSSLENQALTLMSGNLPKTTIPLGNIDKLELYQDYTASGVGLVAALVLPIVLSIIIVRAAR
jgi:hypothetical protein